MASERFDFVNARGETLSGRLERPEGAAHAWALFAHCFTCAKSSHAAVRVSRALASQGVGTLRFDFTGLGDSAGEFGRSGFSGDVADVLAAARAMAAAGRPVSLMVGHSLGGSAVLAAAGDVPEARAVAVVAAPADAEQALGQFGDKLGEIEAKGQAEVELGGRRFVVPRSFVDDARAGALRERIAHLGRALLVLHSPLDEVVPIESASAVFLTAKHPKSFVSLDNADHLLTRPEDAEYAARVIAAWASRYLPPPAAAEAGTRGEARVVETGAGKFQVEVSAGGERFLADEPVEVGGLGSGPSPHELVAAGLGACTVMTARLYAERKGWPLERTRAVVRYENRPAETPASHFERRIAFEGPLAPEQIARLFEIADKCPVHRTLEHGAKIETAPLEAPLPTPLEDPKQAHFEEMDEACRE